MLFVERSNRTEKLLEGLAARLVMPGRDPLAPSVVVVQGPGMERWLAQSISRRYGVCANTEFLFPRQFLEKLLQSTPTEAVSGPNSAWEVGCLVWSIARRLSEGRGDADYEPLARHLEAVDGDRRLVQLSQQIAILLDRYMTYRPDWIRAWSDAPALPTARDERWQARLVRELAADLGRHHLADRAQDFLAAVASPDPRALAAGLGTSLPDIVEIFAVSTLPPLYLSLIDGLANHRDVHLSILSPSRSYWADLWREVREGDLEGAQSGGGEGASGLFDAAPATPAARLLAGLGRLGGDFQRCLEECTSAGGGEVEGFESPVDNAACPSLLARLQADLLDFDSEIDPDAGFGSGARASRIVDRGDDSIQVHLCHGPRRELEVVEAALRNAFDRDPTLTPEDVIVMAPRIDEIAPDIEAVFGVPQDEDRRIPHRIADRGVFQRSPVAEAFRGLLDLLSGRAARSEVLDWLSREPSRARFGLDEEAVERLGEWAERAGIRFGLDEDHREALGLARDRTHTWADGLERLALAHAVGAGADVYAGTAPEPLDPFSDPEVLGSLGDVESMLRAARDQVVKKRGVAAWCRWLGDLLEEACAREDANAHEHSTIRGLLQGFAESATEAGFDEPIPFEAMRERVSEALASTPAPQAFLAGGVTFCELVPLRAIPFRVVVILGMSDQAFPRGRPAPGFDLMARAPRAGDRSTRSDDRYLFLEALLSARDQLILTVPGRDVRDGSDLPPSIVVSELLDALEGSFELAPLPQDPAGGVDPPRTLREAIVVEHALQSFSDRYFEVPGDPRLRGRDEEAYAGARARRRASEAGGGAPRQFLADFSSADPASAAELAPPLLELDELAERLLRSTRHFTRERLRLRLPRSEDVASDLDPVDFDRLEQYSLGSALLEDLTAGVSADEATARLCARSTIPIGRPGELAVRALFEEVKGIAKLAGERFAGPRLADLESGIELDVAGLGPCRIEGHLDGLGSAGRVVVDFRKIAGRSELEAWIRHLFLCACVEQGAELEPRTVLIGRADSKASSDQIVAFERVAEPCRHLSRLFEWAWSANLAPLPFFPKASRRFAADFLDGKFDRAWRGAEETYHGGESGKWRTPESEEGLEHARLWEGLSPISRAGERLFPYRFDAVAEEFFAPFLAARVVESQ
ncbi:MAG: exodeoxyribonuclease V subunit gamma [bacterium]|nr:exodeoxyribonuclease V subunit gamma [bacterium]